MEELKNEEESDVTEPKKVQKNTNIYQSKTDKPFSMSKQELFKNPNRSIGKGMNATHQTKKPHKPRKGR